MFKKSKLFDTVKTKVTFLVMDIEEEVSKRRRKHRVVSVSKHLTEVMFASEESITEALLEEDYQLEDIKAGMATLKESLSFDDVCMDCAKDLLLMGTPIQDLTVIDRTLRMRRFTQRSRQAVLQELNQHIVTHPEKGLILDDTDMIQSLSLPGQRERAIRRGILFHRKIVLDAVITGTFFALAPLPLAIINTALYFGFCHLFSIHGYNLTSDIKAFFKGRTSQDSHLEWRTN